MRGFAYSFYSLTIRSCLAAGLAIGAAMFAAPSTAHADSEKRVALVIGNGDYKIAPHLDNPANDARAIAETLRKLGFEVVDGYDLDVSQMRKAVSDFSAALPQAKSAVVYYSGHGVSVDDEDFLLPVDIDLKSPTDLDISAISLPMVLKQMKLEERVNIVLLDACRDNPFMHELARNKNSSGDRPSRPEPDPRRARAWDPDRLCHRSQQHRAGRRPGGTQSIHRSLAESPSGPRRADRHRHDASSLRGLGKNQTHAAALGVFFADQRVFVQSSSWDGRADHARGRRGSSA